MPRPAAQGRTPRSALRKGGARSKPRAGGRRKISFVAVAEEGGSDEEAEEGEEEEEDELEVDEVTELGEEPDFAAPTSSAEVSPWEGLSIPGKGMSRL